MREPTEIDRAEYIERLSGAIEASSELVKLAVQTNAPLAVLIGMTERIRKSMEDLLGMYGIDRATAWKMMHALQNAANRDPDEEQTLRDWIDNASYEDLLRRQRFGKIGDPIFVDDVGAHFWKVMAEKKAKIGAGGAVAASKRVGWDAP